MLTEVALQPGANLKLAVSQTAEGTVRLAVVPQDAGSDRAGERAALRAGPGVRVRDFDGAETSARPHRRSCRGVSAPSLVPASPEALAVSQAVQTAAPRQASLAPLFANLPVIVASERRAAAGAERGVAASRDAAAARRHADRR